MEPSITVTGENVKALTHPLRVQLLGLLRTYGPATATTLARRLGLTSGALSYHLRQLERYGFIAEDTERGNDRDRWWQAVHRSTTFDAQSMDPTAAEAGEAYELGIINALTRSLTRAHVERAAWPAMWQQAFDLSDVLLELTPEEAERLGRDLLALLQSYPQRDPDRDPRPGTWPVEARFQIVPVGPGEAGGPGEAVGRSGTSGRSRAVGPGESAGPGESVGPSEVGAGEGTPS